jgi:5-methylcytosine-specific restriction endonuclease McrA
MTGDTRPPPAAGEFQLSRLTDYGDAAILAELRRVAALVDSPWLTQPAFARESRVSAGTVRARFGTWGAALARAGLAHRWRGPGAAARAKAIATGRMSDQELLEVLRAAARAAGRDTLFIPDLRKRGGPDVNTYVRRFGSWSNAVRLAGLNSAPRRGPYSDRQCFENLRAVWLHRGRQPTSEEMRRPPSTIGPDAYFHRFGRWRRALAAFLEWAEDARDAGERAGPARAERSRAAGAAPSTARPEATPAARPAPFRRIPLALRHAVLARDRYKCAACGMSPAIYPFCTLEVDHIVPVARGGRSELSNLRTLCSLCNLGKGARLEPGPAPGDPALPPPEPGLPK